jgi:hypothetical protein
MSSNVVLPNIPSGLYSALEKAASKFPLKDSQSASSEVIVKRLDKLVPSFRSSDLDNDETPASSEKNVDYDKIKALLKGPYSSKLFDRHVAVMEKLFIVLKHGIVSL